MKIFYQWEPWAYSNIVSLKVAKKYWIDKKDIYWCFSFKDMFEEWIKNNSIMIVPIENSYAGSVHENFYHLSNYPVKIIWEYYLEINHCLVWLTKDVSKIKEAYSHYQALMQCENYLKNKNIEPKVYWDTAWSAKYIAETQDESKAAITSDLAAQIYNLEVIDKNINDQKWNTTRFFIVIPKKLELWNFSYNKKISILFKVKDMPSVLYKCLWAFATRNINLTKIESLPTKEWQFEYMFWLDFEKPNEKELNWALDELKYFSKQVNILWEY